MRMIDLWLFVFFLFDLLEGVAVEFVLVRIL